MANSENDEVVKFKVQRASAQNALQKISTIVAEEEKIDATKARYTSWFLRYGLILLVLIGAGLARIFGVI